ncbi:MAG: Transcription factor WhiB [Candidatus Saccharibacteria bacterium]|nr:Transcription factor WhiB [Candidatus Saccharibacteria bacterium]MDB5180352.1 Transcription factor WhiB [Candidatus Saccharibacteria bacterium]
MTVNSEFSNNGSQSASTEQIPWDKDALCGQTSPEAFFPEKGTSNRDAKKICGQCEVARECLDYALENDERFGVLGGMSERERRKLKGLGAQAITVEFENSQAKNRRL